MMINLITLEMHEAENINILSEYLINLFYLEHVFHVALKDER